MDAQFRAKSQFWALVLLFVGIGVLMAFTVQLYDAQQDILANQKAGRERTYETRAMICVMSDRLGQILPADGPCFDAHVTKYYGPNPPRPAGVR